MPTKAPFLATCAAMLLLPGFGCRTVEAPPAPPPPAVVVLEPTQKSVQNYGEFPGNLRAVEAVDIRARVEGFLEKIEFEPTKFVRRGETLFGIEREPFQAALDRATANVQASEASLRRTESDLERLELAVQTNAVSEQEVTRARAERDQARAALLAAKAARTQKQIDLDYTNIQSPIDGVIGRNLVDRGNIVGRGETTLLARVSKIDPIHVYFEVPERVLATFLDERGGLGQSYVEGDETAQVFVRVDGMDKTFEGHLDYINPEADSSTGTVETRGVLPNPDLRLLPGFFVRVRVPGREFPDALLVPETALSADLGGRYLLIVGDDNVVEKRYVGLGDLQDDGLRHVTEGLETGERFIIKGLQKARPGLPVNPRTESEAGS